MNDSSDRPITQHLPARLRPRSIAFDLDETIYPREAGIMQAIGQRITLYLEQFLGLSTEEAFAMRQQFVRSHGTTLRGLQATRGIDADAYMEFVHDVPVEEMVGYDPRLDAALEAIDAQKVIFTNASSEHAERVLAARRLRRHFSRIIDIRDMDWVCKPEPSVYPRLLSLLEVPAERCMLIEDNVRNLRPAAAIGISTVLVDSRPEDGAVHFVIDEIWQIGGLYRSLSDQQSAISDQPSNPS
jgi:putative hydrolase of the HAD superfamily